MKQQQKQHPTIYPPHLGSMEKITTGCLLGQEQKKNLQRSLRKNKIICVQKPQRDKVPGPIIPFTVPCFYNRIVLFKLLSAQTPPHTPSFCKCGVKNVGKCVTT